MSTVQNFRITFENIFRRSERKISGATLDLVGTILKNADLDEGEWNLRDSHRIKKKGRERFRAIRVESRSGAKSVRIWCKPRGNDSCFEYSLVPPSWMEAEDVFKILRRANPVSLDVAESPSLPKAFLNHVIGMPPMPPILIIPEKTEVVEIEERTEEGPKMSEEANEKAGGVQPRPEQDRPAGGLVEAQERTSFSLLLDEPCSLSDQEAMDKALVALSLVADEDGYVNKNDASNSMMIELGVRNFVKNVSGGTYTSVEGAMRALTMALSNRGNYIQKILYPSSHNVKSYKLTAKAARRVLALKSKYQIEVVEWPKGGKAYAHGQPLVEAGVWPAKVEQTQQESDEKVEGLTASEVNSELTVFESGDLDRLQALIQECKEAESHIKEVDVVIANLNSEMSDLSIDLEALDLAERERIKQIEELKKDIERIRAKREPIVRSFDQKMIDREGWERDKAPVVAKKSEIEIEIFGVTGRRREN